jgi:hypothetical protein
MLTARRRSPLVRLVWAAAALVTVWCLGCSAFDSLLAGLGGAGESVMTCGSDAGDTAPNGTLAATASTGGQSVSVASVSVTAPRGDACGCQSCVASQSRSVESQLAAQPTPRVERSRPIIPASVTRSPLLPPPERVTQRA